MFVDLTATYDTIWHSSVTCKLLHFRLDRHMISLITELVCNQSFILTTGTGKLNTLKHFKNVATKGSALGTPYLIRPVSRQEIAYIDDLAILHYESNCKHLRELLFRTWQLYPLTFTNGSLRLVQKRPSWQQSSFRTRRHNENLTSLSTDRLYHFVLNPLIFA